MAHRDPRLQVEEVQESRVDRHLDRFARREEEMPVETAEERHRPLGVLTTQGGAWGLRGGVDEIGAPERRRRDLDVDEQFRAERLDEQDATAQAGAVPVGCLAHVFRPDPDRDAAAGIVREGRPLGRDVGRKLQLGLADAADELPSSCSTAASKRFIGGEPTKLATKRFAGRRTGVAGCRPVAACRHASPRRDDPSSSPRPGRA